MLSKFQTSIILRDLKFTAIPKSNSIQLTCDLKTFDDQNVMSSDPKNEFLVKGKSNFYSTKNRNKELETVLNSLFFFFLQKDFACTKTTKITKNTKTQPRKSTKCYKRTKIKNVLKNI